MHTASTWPEIKAMKKKAKTFYLRSLGLIIGSRSYSEVKRLLKEIFTVALHEEDGINETTGLPNICHNARKYLKIQIAGISEDVVDQILQQDPDEFKITLEDDMTYTEDDYNMTGENQNYTEKDTYESDIRAIFEQCKASSDYKIFPCNSGDDDNLYQCPALAKQILVFCEYLPLWSAVMTSYFSHDNITDSSASSESRFNDLKNRVFRQEVLPIRIDEFSCDTYYLHYW